MMSALLTFQPKADVLVIAENCYARQFEELTAA